MSNVKRRALVLYNGSSKGHLSGGEYAHEKMRQSLSHTFQVFEVIPDEFTSRIRSRRLRKLLMDASVPAMVAISYLLYPKYDLVITSWTPKIPYYGDITYVQPYAQAKRVFENFDITKTKKSIAANALMYLPNKLLSGVSERKHIFVANSLYTKERLQKERKTKSVVVYPPVPFNRTKMNDSKENLVLSAGRIVPSKSFDVIGEIGPRIPQAKFVLIGTLGDRGKEIVSAIYKNFELGGVKQNFSYLGWVSEDRKRELLSNSKVIFHPSVDEPFGISVLEGMAEGCIPVVHNSGGPREYVPSKWLFSNLDEAREKIVIALGQWSPEIGEHMREISYSFSVQKFQENFLNVVNVAMARRHSTKVQSAT